MTFAQCWICKNHMVFGYDWGMNKNGLRRFKVAMSCKFDDNNDAVHPIKECDCYEEFK
jgi:hypothetical protein